MLCSYRSLIFLRVQLEVCKRGKLHWRSFLQFLAKTILGGKNLSFVNYVYSVYSLISGLVRQSPRSKVKITPLQTPFRFVSIQMITVLVSLSFASFDNLSHKRIQIRQCLVTSLHTWSCQKCQENFLKTFYVYLHGAQVVHNVHDTIKMIPDVIAIFQMHRKSLFQWGVFRSINRWQPVPHSCDLSQFLVLQHSWPNSGKLLSYDLSNSNP